MEYGNGQSAMGMVSVAPSENISPSNSHHFENRSFQVINEIKDTKDDSALSTPIDQEKSGDASEVSIMCQVILNEGVNGRTI